MRSNIFIQQFTECLPTAQRISFLGKGPDVVMVWDYNGVKVEEKRKSNMALTSNFDVKGYTGYRKIMINFGFFFIFHSFKLKEMQPYC